jgi:hypothetical protein
MLGIGNPGATCATFPLRGPPTESGTSALLAAARGAGVHTRTEAPQGMPNTRQAKLLAATAGGVGPGLGIPSGAP